MVTFRELMDGMGKCTTKEEAKELVDRTVATILEDVPAMTTLGAYAVALDNIGYLTGYFDRKEADRLMTLFETKHPFLGGPGEWPVDPAEILAIGMKAGQEAKSRSTQAPKHSGEAE